MTPSISRPVLSFSFSELLDRTFRIYRENFVTMAGWVALVTIPITIITLLLSPSTVALLGNQPLRATGQADFSQFIANILSFIQTILIVGPLTYMTSESLFGRKVSIGEAFSATQKRFGSIGCGLFLFGFVIGVFAVVVIIAGALFPPLFAGLGFVIYLGIAIGAMLTQVLTLEAISASQGITRAWVMGKSRFWTLIGLALVIGLITGIVAAVLGGALGALVTAVMPRGSGSMVPALIVSFFSIVVVSILSTPIQPIAFTLLYYDIRVKSEGLDIALESAANPDMRPVDVPAPPAKFSLDGKDWRNIAILVVISLVMGLLLAQAFAQFMDNFTRGLR